MFDKHLLVNTNTRYTIQLNMEGSTACSGESYKDIVALNELSVTFLSFHYLQQTVPMKHGDKFLELLHNILIRNKLV